MQPFLSRPSLVKVRALQILVQQPFSLTRSAFIARRALCFFVNLVLAHDHGWAYLLKPMKKASAVAMTAMMVGGKATCG